MRKESGCTVDVKKCNSSFFVGDLFRIDFATSELATASFAVSSLI